MGKKLKIGILTSGGDCPGLNALIASATLGAFQKEWEITGIKHGFTGLFDQPKTMDLTPEIVHGISSLGGSILGTSNNVDPFQAITDGHPKDRSKEIIENIKKLRLDALLIAGGDGSLTICNHLSECGVPIIGIPKTIDNDVFGTDLTIGFLTAVQSTMKAAESVRDSGTSHRRIMILETMGRATGWIALYGGVAVIADVILIPEIKYSIDKLATFLQERHRDKEKGSLIIISEGIVPEKEGAALQLAKELEDRIDVSVRANVLGHIQRGGAPIAQDRNFAFECGIYALELISKKIFNRYLVYRNGALDSIEFSNGAKKTKFIQPESHMVTTAKNLGISFGL